MKCAKFIAPPQTVRNEFQVVWDTILNQCRDLTRKEIHHVNINVGYLIRYTSSSYSAFQIKTIRHK